MSESLRTEKIGQALTSDFYRLFYADSVDSTNECAKREAADGAPEGNVYLADTQTGGKGRMGRKWDSPEGTSVSMSLILRPAIPLARVSMVTLVMGMAAADGIRAVSGLDTQIKWPNDVVYNGKKLCGILTEMGADGRFVVSGIGINVNAEHFPDELKEKATSVFLETGTRCERENVTAAVLDYFDRYYHVFLETGDLTKLADRYQEMLVNCGRRVHVIDPKEPFDGTALGIDRMGDLLIRRDDSGEVVSVFAGEVSVRGIYGYV